LNQTKNEIDVKKIRRAERAGEEGAEQEGRSRSRSEGPGAGKGRKQTEE
jgi:hypothetical protein